MEKMKRLETLFGYDDFMNIIKQYTITNDALFIDRKTNSNGTIFIVMQI